MIFHKKALGFKMTDFPEGKPDAEGFLIDLFHGNIEPVSSQGSLSILHFPYDFFSPDIPVTDIGSGPCSTLSMLR